MDKYVLVFRDGVQYTQERFENTNKALEWMQKNMSFSWTHAFEYEGFTLVDSETGATLLGKSTLWL